MKTIYRVFKQNNIPETKDGVYRIYEQSKTDIIKNGVSFETIEEAENYIESQENKEGLCIKPIIFN